MKKIKIKLKDPTSSISELLKELGIDIKDIDIIVNMEENKETYKKLSTSEFIDDWDFASNPLPSCNCNKDVNHSEDKPKVDNDIIDRDPELQTAEAYGVTFGLTNINELSTFVEAVWASSVKSPNIIFGSKLFITSVKNNYDTVANSCLTMEHELLKMIIENYYGDNTFNDILTDTLNKLKNNWNVLPNQSSLAGVAKLLYEFKK